ncbi:MAG: UDP-glucose 4-epimerase GalE [Anaerolineae bacterium]|nr:UDP-glucose 4-epimerase GalE [Anaerolineae bacterium]
MKILVTGGAGYIGSVVAEELLKAGEEVIVVDSLALGHRAAVPSEAAFEQGDLRNRAFLDRVFSAYKPDAVMHFAANSLVSESVADPLRYFRNNVGGGLTLFEAMVAHGTLKLILSSTANLFAAPRRIPIAEDEPIVPGSPYGETKCILERMLAWLDATCGLRYAALRYFNAAGATETRGEDHRPETHLIPIVLQVALGKRAHVQIYGDDYPTRDGTCVRDYIHVVDLAQAHILALRALDRGSCVYNLGNGRGFTVREVIETARRVTGHPIPAVVGPRRPGDPPELVAASDKIARELGWKPRYPDLETIIQTAWEWHRRHPDGYRD